MGSWKDKSNCYLLVKNYQNKMDIYRCIFKDKISGHEYHWLPLFGINVLLL